jgi:hypothetical protein
VKCWACSEETLGKVYSAVSRVDVPLFIDDINVTLTKRVLPLLVRTSVVRILPNSSLATIFEAPRGNPILIEARLFGELFVIR